MTDDHKKVADFVESIFNDPGLSEKLKALIKKKYPDLPIAPEPAKDTDDEESYAQFLEDRLEEIDEILARLLMKQAICLNKGTVINMDDEIFKELEEWTGCDWWISLSEEDQEIFIRESGQWDDEYLRQTGRLKDVD
jgi:predicted nuclease of restriction endonuclease-like RecB superfamily